MDRENNSDKNKNESLFSLFFLIFMICLALCMIVGMLIVICFSKIILGLSLIIFPAMVFVMLQSLGDGEK